MSCGFKTSCNDLSLRCVKLVIMYVCMYEYVSYINTNKHKYKHK